MYESVRFSFYRIMDKRGIKKIDLAKKTGYGRDSISHFFSGTSSSDNVAKAIADVLGVALVHYGGKDMIVEDFKEYER